MGNGTRTLAFQVSEELFGRVKGYLAKHPGLSQREFVIGLITKELERYEAEKAQEEAAEIQEGQEADTDAS